MIHFALYYPHRTDNRVVVVDTKTDRVLKIISVWRWDPDDRRKKIVAAVRPGALGVLNSGRRRPATSANRKKGRPFVGRPSWFLPRERSQNSSFTWSRISLGLWYRNGSRNRASGRRAVAAALASVSNPAKKLSFCGAGSTTRSR